MRAHFLTAETADALFIIVDRRISAAVIKADGFPFHRAALDADAAFFTFFFYDIGAALEDPEDLEQIDTCPASREDLKAEYQFRYDVISEYAPKQMSADEVKAYIQEKFADVLATKNKGAIMKAVMADMKGKADGIVINQTVAELCK